jgi:heme exporter protein D
MSHAVFVGAAYAISALAILGLVAWIVADLRARRRELAALERLGVTRRSAATGRKDT